MKIRRSLLKGTVAVETYTGEGAYGPVYASAVTVPCNLDTTRRLVRNANGEESVSECTLYVHPDNAAAFAAQSRLTVGGRTSTVLAASSQEFRGQAHHTKVACT